MLPSALLRTVGSRVASHSRISSSIRSMCSSRNFGLTARIFPVSSMQTRVPTVSFLTRRWDSSSASPPPSPPSASTTDPNAEGPVPDYDPDLLMELGLEHMKPAQLHKFLQEEGLTLDQLKMAVDAGMHMPPEGDRMDVQKWRQRSDRMEGPWSTDSIIELNPRRKLFPGMTYSPEDLSPNTPVDYSKMREDNKLKGCPLGGRKGPKIDWTNVQLLSRFISEGGKILPKRKTNVCSKKQRELARSVKRARQMNLIPYLSKLPEFQRREAPPIFFKRERGPPRGPGR